MRHYSVLQGLFMFAMEKQDVIKSYKAPQQIIGKIRSAILARELEPGERLPTESELMRYFGVSRLAMREALCALESMGLVRIRSGLGGGAYVTGVDMEIARGSLSNFLHDKDFSVHHITEVRLALEPYAAAMAAQRFSPAECESLRDLLVACRRAIDQDEPLEKLRELEFRFHAGIVAAMDNPVWKLLHDFADNLLWDVKRRLKTQAAFSRNVLAMHEKILAAIETGDASLAEDLMRQDILHVEHSLATLAGDQARLQLM